MEGLAAHRFDCEPDTKWNKYSLYKILAFPSTSRCDYGYSPSIHFSLDTFCCGVEFAYFILSVPQDSRLGL